MGCKNILIIEDETSISQMMKDILSIEGYTVQTAEDGLEGLKKLQEMNTESEPCVVLLDLMMPRANGWWFLDNQRNDPALSKIPVVICSAYEESAKSVRPSGYVPKPVQLDNLLSAVKQFCVHAQSHA